MNSDMDNLDIELSSCNYSLRDGLYRALNVINETHIEDLVNNTTSLFTKLKLHCGVEEVACFAKLLTIHGLASNQNDGTLMQPLEFFTKPFLTLIFVIVGCIGLFGNLFTVLVIYKTASLHSHTNYFLASLASSDFFLIVIGVPYDIIHIWKNGEPPDVLGYCAFTSTTISLFTFASILTIVSLTAERFQAICYPFAHRAVFHRSRVMKLIYCIWIIAAIPSIYLGMMFKRVRTDFCGNNHENVGSCDVTGDFKYIFEMTMILTFVLPLFFIVFCYVRILATLNQMSANTTVHAPVGTMNSDSSQLTRTASYYQQHQNFALTVHTKSDQAPRSQQAQKMVIKMLVTVTAVFFVCYLPHHLQRLTVQYIKERCEKSTFCLLLYPITGLLQYISATLNPIFYNLMSNRFRNAFNKLIKDFISKSDREYSTLARL